MIRVWEKRYRAVVPERSATNRRFSTDSDVRRLLLLRKATVSGYSIGQIAHLSDEEISGLIRDEGGPAASDSQDRRFDHKISSAEEHLESSVSAIDEVVIIVGGRSAGTYRNVIIEIRAILLPDMKNLRQQLDSLRSLSS